MGLNRAAAIAVLLVAQAAFAGGPDRLVLCNAGAGCPAELARAGNGIVVLLDDDALRARLDRPHPPVVLSINRKLIARMREGSDGERARLAIQVNAARDQFSQAVDNDLVQDELALLRAEAGDESKEAAGRVQSAIARIARAGQPNTLGATAVRQAIEQDGRSIRELDSISALIREPAGVRPKRDTMALLDEIAALRAAWNPAGAPANNPSGGDHSDVMHLWFLPGITRNIDPRERSEEGTRALPLDGGMVTLLRDGDLPTVQKRRLVALDPDELDELQARFGKGEVLRRELRRLSGGAAREVQIFQTRLAQLREARLLRWIDAAAVRALTPQDATLAAATRDAETARQRARWSSESREPAPVARTRLERDLALVARVLRDRGDARHADRLDAWLAGLRGR